PSQDFSLKLSALLQEINAEGAYEATVLPGLGQLSQNYNPGLGGYDRKVEAYSANLHAKLGIVDLTSVTGYSISKSSNSLDFSYALGFPFAIFTDGETKKFSQEIRATLPIGSRVEWLIGGFYTNEDSPYTQEIAS